MLCGLFSAYYSLLLVVLRENLYMRTRKQSSIAVFPDLMLAQTFFLFMDIWINLLSFCVKKGFLYHQTIQSFWRQTFGTQSSEMLWPLPVWFLLMLSTSNQSLSYNSCKCSNLSQGLTSQFFICRAPLCFFLQSVCPCLG